MEMQGFVRHAAEVKSGVSKSSGKPWKMRDYVIEIPGQIPKHMVFTVFGEENMKKFNIRKDEEIKVYFDIEARELGGKWYNTIKAWRVDHIGSAPHTPQQPVVQAPQAPPPSADGQAAEGDASDLPF